MSFYIYRAPEAQKVNSFPITLFDGTGSMHKEYPRAIKAYNAVFNDLGKKKVEFQWAKDLYSLEPFKQAGSGNITNIFISIFQMFLSEKAKFPKNITIIFISDGKEEFELEKLLDYIKRMKEKYLIQFISVAVGDQFPNSISNTLRSLIHNHDPTCPPLFQVTRSQTKSFQQIYQEFETIFWEIRKRLLVSGELIYINIPVYYTITSKEASHYVVANSLFLVDKTQQVKINDHEIQPTKNQADIYQMIINSVQQAFISQAQIKFQEAQHEFGIIQVQSADLIKQIGKTQATEQSEEQKQEDIKLHATLNVAKQIAQGQLDLTNAKESDLTSLQDYLVNNVNKFTELATKLKSSTAKIVKHIKNTKNFASLVNKAKEQAKGEQDKDEKSADSKQLQSQASQDFQDSDQDQTPQNKTQSVSSQQDIVSETSNSQNKIVEKGDEQQDQNMFKKNRDECQTELADDSNTDQIQQSPQIAEKSSEENVSKKEDSDLENANDPITLPALDDQQDEGLMKLPVDDEEMVFVKHKKVVQEEPAEVEEINEGIEQDAQEETTKQEQLESNTEQVNDVEILLESQPEPEEQIQQEKEQANQNNHNEPNENEENQETIENQEPISMPALDDQQDEGLMKLPVDDEEMVFVKHKKAVQEEPVTENNEGAEQVETNLEEINDVEIQLESQPEPEEQLLQEENEKIDQNNEDQPNDKEENQEVIENQEPISMPTLDDQQDEGLMKLPVDDEEMVFVKHKKVVQEEPAAEVEEINEETENIIEEETAKQEQVETNIEEVNDVEIQLESQPEPEQADQNNESNDKQENQETIENQEPIQMPALDDQQDEGLMKLPVDDEEMVFVKHKKVVQENNEDAGQEEKQQQHETNIEEEINEPEIILENQPNEEEELLEEQEAKEENEEQQEVQQLPVIDDFQEEVMVKLPVDNEEYVFEKKHNEETEANQQNNENNEVKDENEEIQDVIQLPALDDQQDEGLIKMPVDDEEMVFEKPKKLTQHEPEKVEDKEAHDNNVEKQEQKVEDINEENEKQDEVQQLPVLDNFDEETLVKLPVDDEEYVFEKHHKQEIEEDDQGQVNQNDEVEKQNEEQLEEENKSDLAKQENIVEEQAEINPQKEESEEVDSFCASKPQPVSQAQELKQEIQPKQTKKNYLWMILIAIVVGYTVKKLRQRK